MNSRSRVWSSLETCKVKALPKSLLVGTGSTVLHIHTMGKVCVCVQQGAVAPLDLIIKHLRGVGLPERFSDGTHAEDDV